MAGNRMQKKKKKLKVPKNRKFMIRDLPVGAASLLHPSLRGILTARQKRWNSGSPSHRIAVNLVRRYKKVPKPRVYPFFCDRCRFSTRFIWRLKEHRCEKEDKRKADRKEAAMKCKAYDFTTERKLALNPHKAWRSNAMAVMEQSLRPDLVLPRVEIGKIPKTAEPIDATPDEEFLEAEQEEFEDDTEHFQLADVLVPAHLTRPKTTLRSYDCNSHYCAGVFCFNCKETFESYNQFQLHLTDEFNGGKCSRSLPDYYYVEKKDPSGMFNQKYKHSVMRHRAMKRDVSHVQCTLCKAMNFASTQDLFNHMVKCAAASSKDGGLSPLDRPTVFGGGMPPSFNACQYIFPARDRTPLSTRQKSE